jgi:hypothetical protein
MGLNKCLCGRLTGFGTLCVFCSRDKLLDRADDQAMPDDTCEHEQEEDCHDCKDLEA